MKKTFVSLLSKVIMELSLKMMSSYHYVKRMIFSITSLNIACYVQNKMLCSKQNINQTIDKKDSL